MNGVVGFLIVLILIPYLIGAAIMAWLHKLGFRFVVKTPKEDVPVFLKRFAVQLLVLIVAIGFGYLFYKHLSNTSLNDLSASAPLFPLTKIGVLEAMIAYSVVNLFLYTLLVAVFTKILTKFNWASCFKSQIFIIVISSLIYAGIIAYAYKVYIVNLPETESAQYSVSIDVPAESVDRGSLSKSNEISGIWVIDIDKSKALCAHEEDETYKAICTASVDGAVLATMNSDGILIQNNTLQDGPNICNLAVRNESNFKYSCINPLDRSVYARLNQNADNSLSFSAGMVNLVLHKK